MSYEDYEKGDWEVESPGAAECKSGSKVTFGGQSDKVTVLCNGELPYGKANAKYKKDDTIMGPDYVISMVKGSLPRRIKFCPEGRVAGSWTAEDQSPWREPEGR